MQPNGLRCSHRGFFPLDLSDNIFTFAPMFFHQGWFGDITTLRETLLVGSKHQKGSLSVTCVVVDVDRSGTAPAHDQAPEGFAFTQILFGIKVLCSCSTSNAERHEKLADEQMPNIMRSKAHRAQRLQCSVMPIPVPLKTLDRVGSLPFRKKERFMVLDILEYAAPAWIM